MPADKQAGYVQPSPGGVTLYLDSEETGRLVDGIEVVRQRVSDPLVQSRLLDAVQQLGVVASAASGSSGGSIDLGNVESLLDDLIVLASGVENNTDELEGLIDTVETLLSSRATEATLIQVRDSLDTVEAKLQLIIDNTDTLEATITDVDLNTDQIETQLTSIFNELLAKLEAGDITGLATSAKQDSIITLLTTIRDNADTVEAKLQSIADNTDGLEGLVDGIEGLLTTIRDNSDTVEAKLQTLIDQSDALESGVSQIATNTQGLALQSTLANRFGADLTSKTFLVTASGINTLITPDSGQRIKVYWVTAVNDPEEDTTPLIRIRFSNKSDPNNIYMTYVIGHWEIFTGDIDESLQCLLNKAGAVAITIHYKQL